MYNKLWSQFQSGTIKYLIYHKVKHKQKLNDIKKVSKF